MMKRRDEIEERGSMPFQLGVQWVIELYGCSRERIEKAGAVEEIMVSAARISNSVITKTIFHEFSERGVNGLVAMLSGAYLAIHTWPDKGYAALDIFSAGSVMPQETAAFIAGRLGAGRTLIYLVPRGKFDESGVPTPPRKVTPIDGAAAPEVPKIVRAAIVLFGLIF